jgi:HrpA-like RNA helicase
LLCREGTLALATFPSTLTNIERKFLHKLAEELGLKSKSQGEGTNRYITVFKQKEEGDDASQCAELELSDKVTKLLLSAEANLSAMSAQREAILQSVASGDNGRDSGSVSKLQNQLPRLKTAYENAQAARRTSPQYAASQKKRQSLPAAQHRSAVCQLVHNNQIVLISGETGCGKTTQVPQFIFDDESIGPSCRIAVTQPRRLSAISVAERIAFERGEKIGGTVGYNIRLESEKCADTQILFVTPGLLIRKLQTDPLLEEFSHIVIDEAHERDRFTEFLMIILRDVCSRRKDLKLILMSATLHTNKLSTYFGACPHIHMGGSVFPVQEFFLEHVLKFTKYLTTRNSKFGRGQHGSSGGFSEQKAMSKFIETNQTYCCTLCNNGQVFSSPEELGTHAAFCFGPSEGAVAARKPAHSGNRRPDLKTLFSSFEKSAKEAPASAATTRENTDANGQALMKTVSGKKAAVSADADADADADATESESEDSDDEPEVEQSLSSSIQGVEGRGNVDMDNVQGIDDTNSADNDNLRQYQAMWDDSQVDYDIVQSLLQYIVTSEFAKMFATTGGNHQETTSGGGGSILIFMPGWDDISKMHRILSSHPLFGNTSKYKLIQLHSGIPKKDQREIFVPVPKNQHKIILSTNIAETSITIDDVTVVIDTGRAKEKVYDPHVKLSYLKSTWISQASARQRKGRAGRTCAGACFHLFSKTRHRNMSEYQDSELLRMPLEELVLQTKILGVAPGKKDETDSAQSFLLNALDPPHVLSITNAVEMLQLIGCLDDNEAITPIGTAVSKLPMDPKVSRAILLGCLCGCGPSLLGATATMSYRDPFLMPTGDKADDNMRIKQAFAGGMPSDQFAVLKALEQYRTIQQRFSYSQTSKFCDESNLSRSTMSFLGELTDQLAHTLKDVGIAVNNNRVAANNGNVGLVSSLISMALYPEIGVRNSGGSFSTEKGRKARIHPSSINHGASLQSKKSQMQNMMSIVGYQDMISGNPNRGAPGAPVLSMLNTSAVQPLALLLAAGRVREIDSKDTGMADAAAAAAATGNDSDEEWAAATASVAKLSVSDKADARVVHLEIDGWITIKSTAKVARLVMLCRQCLGDALDMFVSNSSASAREGALQPPLPYQVIKIMDVITAALAAEQVPRAVEAPRAAPSADAGRKPPYRGKR